MSKYNILATKPVKEPIVHAFTDLYRLVEGYPSNKCYAKPVLDDTIDRDYFTNIISDLFKDITEKKYRLEFKEHEYRHLNKPKWFLIHVRYKCEPLDDTLLCKRVDILNEGENRGYRFEVYSTNDNKTSGATWAWFRVFTREVFDLDDELKYREQKT